MKSTNIDFAVIIVLFLVCAVISWMLNPILAVLALVMCVAVWELFSDYFYLKVKTRNK